MEEDISGYTDEEEILSVKWKDGVLEVTRMSHGENGVVSSRIPTARLADYFVVVGYRNDGQSKSRASPPSSSSSS